MIFIIFQIGCESFTQLFTRHPEVMEYLGEYDSMVVDGISVGEALRSSSSCLLPTLRHFVFCLPYVTLSLVNHTSLCLLSTIRHSVSCQPSLCLLSTLHHSVNCQPTSLCLLSTLRHSVSCQPYVTLSLVNLTSLCLSSTFFINLANFDTKDNSRDLKQFCETA